MTIVATILAILKALPQVLSLVKSVWSLWSAIRYEAQVKKIEEEVSKEHDKIAEGGRPDWDRS